VAGSTPDEELTAEQREARARARSRRAANGKLVAVVEVRVFEHGQLAQVTVPDGATLDVGDPAALADVVRRATEELSDWR